jgi:hypothetical protein
MLIVLLILTQAASIFAAGILFAYDKLHPAAIAGAIGGTLTAVELISVTGFRVQVGREAE